MLKSLLDSEGHQTIMWHIATPCEAWYPAFMKRYWSDSLQSMPTITELDSYCCRNKKLITGLLLSALATRNHLNWLGKLWPRFTGHLDNKTRSIKCQSAKTQKELSRLYIWCCRPVQKHDLLIQVHNMLTLSTRTNKYSKFLTKAPFSKLTGHPKEPARNSTYWKSCCYQYTTISKEDQGKSIPSNFYAI